MHLLAARFAWYTDLTVVAIIKNLLMDAYVTAIAMTDVVSATDRFPPSLLFSKNWFISPCFENSDIYLGHSY